MTEDAKVAMSVEGTQSVCLSKSDGQRGNDTKTPDEVSAKAPDSAI
jgi:hypothetical protein